MRGGSIKKKKKKKDDWKIYGPGQEYDVVSNFNRILILKVLFGLRKTSRA